MTVRLKYVIVRLLNVSHILKGIMTSSAAENSTYSLMIIRISI